jgi:hypothetical protein
MRYTDLDITGAPVQVQMEVFYLAELCELVGDVLLRRLFMYVGD